MVVDELKRQEEILPDRSPETKLKQRLQRDLWILRPHSLQNADRLRPNVEPCLRMAAGVAQRSSKDRHLDRSLRRRSAAEPGAMNGRSDIQLVVRRHHRGGIRIFRKED